MSPETQAYAVVFGLLGVALVMIAISQALMGRALMRLRVANPTQWQQLGSPTLFGRDRDALRGALAWLRSPDAHAIGGGQLAVSVRVAWVLQYLGAAAFFLWVGLWLWAVL